MCCIPPSSLTLILFWIWSDPYADSDSVIGIVQWLALPCVLVLVPITLVLDICIVLPWVGIGLLIFHIRDQCCRSKSSLETEYAGASITVPEIDFNRAERERRIRMGEVDV